MICFISTDDAESSVDCYRFYNAGCRRRSYNEYRIWHDRGLRKYHNDRGGRVNTEGTVCARNSPSIRRSTRVWTHRPPTIGRFHTLRCNHHILEHVCDNRIRSNDLNGKNVPRCLYRHCHSRGILGFRQILRGQILRGHPPEVHPRLQHHPPSLLNIMRSNFRPLTLLGAFLHGGTSQSSIRKSCSYQQG